MLWRVILVVLLHLSLAQGPLRNGKRGAARAPPVRRPQATGAAAQDGTGYYGTGYQGYPSQQGQATYPSQGQPGYRDASTTNPPPTYRQAPDTPQTSQPAGSTVAATPPGYSPAGPQTSSAPASPSAPASSSDASAAGQQPSASSTASASASASTSSADQTAGVTDRSLVFSSQPVAGPRTTTAGAFVQPGQYVQPSGFPSYVQQTPGYVPATGTYQPQGGTTLIVTNKPVGTTQPQANNFVPQPSSAPAFVQPSATQPQLLQPAKGPVLTPIGVTSGVQPVTNPGVVSPGVQQAGTPIVQGKGTIATLPSATTPIPPATVQPAIPPASASPPVTPGVPSVVLTTPPLPAPLYGPGSTSYDYHGCVTPDTMWCPNTMSCLAVNLFNITCQFTPPVYLNSFTNECADEALAMWQRLNATQTIPTAPYLSTWFDGPIKSILLDFISRVTNESLPTFVPRDQRVATFDNDGTSWPEIPLLPQLAFLQWFVKRFPDPGQILSQQLQGYMDGTTNGDPMSALLSGLNMDMYHDFIQMWGEEAKHPTLGRSYTEVTYAPQIELMNLLQANCFNVFMVSGGETIFMRTLLPKVYGIPPPNWVGSFMELKYEQDPPGSGSMEFKIYPRQPVVVDRMLKAVAIQRAIGSRPILAFGNSDGDFEMLQYTTDAPGQRLGLLLKHDDPVREFSYDSHMPRSMDAAASKGWLFATVKRDWKTIFQYQNQKPIVYIPRVRPVSTPPPTAQPTPQPSRFSPMYAPVSNGAPVPLSITGNLNALSNPTYTITAPTTPPLPISVSIPPPSPPPTPNSAPIIIALPSVPAGSGR